MTVTVSVLPIHLRVDDVFVDNGFRVTRRPEAFNGSVIVTGRHPLSPESFHSRNPNVLVTVRRRQF